MNLVCDLGTANFRAAIVGSNTIINEPCVVAYDGRGQTIVGSRAQEMIGRSPALMDVTEPVDGGVISDPAGAGEVLRLCLQKLAPSRFARKVTLTFSIPTGLTEVEKRALEDVGLSAGANKVNFVNASVAAAVAAGLPVQNPTGCLIVNLGAGVTEVALLSLNGIVASHRAKQGGRDIDKAIIERLKREYGFILGMRSAEKVKRILCDDPDLSGYDIRGKNLRTGLPGQLRIPRELIDEEITAYCSAIVDLIGEAISSCPPELVGDVVDRGIVMVGGGARIRGVLSRLTDSLDVPVIVSDDPETCVIRGLMRSQRDSAVQPKVDRGSRLPSWKGLKNRAQQYASVFGGRDDD